MEHLTAEVERFMQGSLFESLDEANAALRERFSGPIDDMPSMATTPLEKAQDLMYRAFEARGRRRIQLARKALELSADCADAYVVLAEESHAPDNPITCQGAHDGNHAQKALSKVREVVRQTYCRLHGARASESPP